MANTTQEELEVKNSTESAQTFIDWFYTSVSDRKPLASFYVNSNTKYSTAGAAAEITVNGMVCAQPADFEALLTKQAGVSASTPNGFKVRYDVDGFDVHVLNPQFRLGCPEAVVQRMTPGTPAYETTTPAQLKTLQMKMVSLLVQVTGHVQYGAGKEAPRGAFQEAFVLVPNWDAVAGGPRTPRGLRSYLILSQNFRSL